MQCVLAMMAHCKVVTCSCGVRWNPDFIYTQWDWIHVVPAKHVQDWVRLCVWHTVVQIRHSPNMYGEIDTSIPPPLCAQTNIWPKILAATCAGCDPFAIVPGESCRSLGSAPLPKLQVLVVACH